MKRHSYRERDYDFGQAMLSLRMRMGLTQAGMADLLKISRHAVGEWEAGLNYPKALHLQHFVALCVQQRVFAHRQPSQPPVRRRVSEWQEKTFLPVVHTWIGSGRWM